MNLVKHIASLDNIIWRCQKRNPKHDSKINIRADSIFENLQIKIHILYFLLYYCFAENISINNAVLKCNDFCNKIGETGISQASVTKFFKIVGQKIKDKMHKVWDKNLLGVIINPELGYGSVEIDESKIISSNNLIYWMFGVIDRNTKEARVRCVLNNRTKDKLLPIIKKYVYSGNDSDELDLDEYDEEGNIIIEENYSIKTRVFSDCFRSYQIEDFDNMGYILKRVNHSVWFGMGLLHTNTIESLWHQLKLITQNFSGLNIENLIKSFNSDENQITNYLDGWICYALLISEIRIKKLNWSGRIDLLSNYLIID